MSVIAEKERFVLKEFRLQIEDLPLSVSQRPDYFLMRWLRARDYDVDKAKVMLINYLDFRKTMDLDNILSWEPSKEWETLAPSKLLGYDYENSPVLLIPIGKWNIRKFLEVGLINEYLRFVERLYEEVEALMACKKTPEGLPVSQFVYIFDVDKLSIRAFSNVKVMDTFLQGLKNFEAYRPETVKRMFILNTGRVFATVYALVKPILAEKTSEKLRIFGSDPESYKAELLKEMPPSILPPLYGGTNTEAEGATNFVVEDEDEDDLEFISTTMRAGEKFILNFGVDEGNSRILWAFKTEDYDISFGVTRDGKAYIENKRVNSHVEMQEGDISCDQPGDYIFTFDNTYSRLRSKVLSYRIDLNSPSGLKQIA